MIAVRALLAGDVANVGRDPMLVGMPLAPLALAAGLRFGLPPAVALLQPWVDLGSHRGFVVAMAMLLPPLLFGLVVGFLLLEERDQRVLEAVAVTPLGTRGFLLWRLLAPTALCAVAVAGLALAGSLPLSGARLAVVAAVIALEVPLLALFLGAFAADKVQGLALGKLGSLPLLAPLALPLVGAPWAWAGAVAPQWWAVQAALAPTGAAFVGFTAGALAVHAAWIAWLWRRFLGRVG